MKKKEETKWHLGHTSILILADVELNLFMIVLASI